MKRVLLAFIAGLIVMGGASYWLYLHHFSRTQTIKEGEVVDGIRSLNRLVVFQAYITATTTTHDVGWVWQSDQTMLTPAYVNYYVDMATVTPDRIRIRGKDVFVALPGLMIERPNVDTLHILTFNSGVWSNLSDTADRLRVKNSKMALGQLFQRAKDAFLVDAAKKAAVTAVEANIRNALAGAGQADTTIHVIAT